MTAFVGTDRQGLVDGLLASFDEVTSGEGPQVVVLRAMSGGQDPRGPGFLPPPGGRPALSSACYVGRLLVRHSHTRSRLLAGPRSSTLVRVAPGGVGSALEIVSE
jgi:hypothetical protein